METTSVSDEGGSGRGCVAMATTPGSPSSGYWSTNDDDLSNDVISASLGFDPSVGYGGCWLPSPYRDLEDEFDDGDVGLSFCADTTKPEEVFGPEMRFQPEADMDLGPEMVLETEAVLEPEVLLEPEVSADFTLDLTQEPEPRPEVESELEPEMSLATGSSLLADFLFCDWLHGSRSTDRVFDDFISGDVFPEDVFDGSELALVDPSERWKESSTGSPRELERRSLADDDEEERTSLDEDRIFSTDALTFDLDPVHPFEPFTPGCSPISPLSPIDRLSLDCYETPEADRNSSSGCASPLDVASGSATPVSDFRSSCLNSGELFDVLLCEVLRPTPEADPGTEVVKPELVLVATPSASKRKSSDDAGNERPRKTQRLRLKGFGAGIQEDSRRIELPVTLVAASSNMLQVTSACERPSNDRPRNFGDSVEMGKIQGGRDSRTSGEFPDVGISHEPSGFPKTENEHLRTKSDHTCAKETTLDACADGSDACAVRRAEVLAAMLQAEAVLREPNRGSDVIFAELRSRRVGEAKSPASVGPSSPSPSQAPGASSLRSFLIRKQRDSSGSGQNLLHRLLKGETSEAEVRREQAASGQTTRKSAVADKS